MLQLNSLIHRIPPRLCLGCSVKICKFVVMGNHIRKSHNKSLLLYHFVCPIKYRRTALSESFSKTLSEICLQIEESYEILFLEIGFDGDHVHFLLQGVPSDFPKKIIGGVFYKDSSFSRAFRNTKSGINGSIVDPAGAQKPERNLRLFY
ncbi:IS200/IS605 family transposase [Sinomicrobium sp. M5D2P9]